MTAIIFVLVIYRCVCIAFLCQFLCRFIFIHAQRIYNFIYNVHYKKGNIGVQYASVVFFPCLFVSEYSSWPLYLSSESAFVYKCHFVESDAFSLNLSDSTLFLSILYITKNILIMVITKRMMGAWKEDEDRK